MSNPSLVSVVKKCLLEAGSIVRAGFYKPRRVQFKSRGNPVTDIDVAAEKKIAGIIHQFFPEHDFLGEESDFSKAKIGLQTSKGRSSDYCWIADPLDGTINFVHGLPQVCVSVAVAKKGRVLAGGVYDPIRKELFLAERGRGATLNGKSIRVSSNRTLTQSLLVTGFPYDRQQKADIYLSLAISFLRKSMDLRRMGAAALDMAWVASGRVDGYWEFNLKPWDSAAGWLLVEEAGGKVTNFGGQPYNLTNTSQTLVSNGHIHPAMLRVLKAHRMN